MHTPELNKTPIPPGAGTGANAYAAALQPFGDRLEAQALMKSAEAATGLSDWGGQRWEEERFRHDLAVLCDAIEETGRVSEIGRNRSHSRLFTMLVSRLRYVAARKATPGVEAQKVVAPLLGMGMPRAGTTFLHGLLAQDPANRVARTYESALTVPLGGPHGDLGEKFYQEILTFQDITNPELTDIHPCGAELPEECLFLQEGNCCSLYTVYWNVPDFMSVIFDKAPSDYRWQLGVMQYMQAIKPGGRWALKSPHHVFTVPEMRMAFPDALVYVNHRDPGKVVPSIASLYLALRRRFSDVADDRVQVGAALLDIWGRAMNGYVDWRSGPGRDENLIDIHFADLVARPIETVEMLYEKFSIPFTVEARDNMLRHLDRDHHGKGPARAYTLSEFGLSEATIEAHFARYIDHFQIKREKRA